MVEQETIVFPCTVQDMIHDTIYHGQTTYFNTLNGQTKYFNTLTVHVLLLQLTFNLHDQQ